MKRERAWVNELKETKRENLWMRKEEKKYRGNGWVNKWINEESRQTDSGG